jgi:LPXTG-motif cell wall-anchored protein
MGGAYSESSSATSGNKIGPVTFGGVSFGSTSAGSSKTIWIVAIGVILAIGGFFLLRK